MLLSWNWLNEFIQLNRSPEEVAERLTVTGSEIESLCRADADVSGLVIAKIVECVQHPTKSGLCVTKLDVGDGVLRTCVTAAKNVQLGDVIAYAISGSKVKSGLTLGMRDFDGVVSDGMMGSAAELGWPDLASEPGILILPQDAPLGADVQEYLGLHDYILDLSITPNRGDMLSYLGVAREIKALFPESRLIEPTTTYQGSDEELPKFSVEVTSPKCSRYDLAYIDDIRSVDTPIHEKVKLVLSGMRPVNPLVDATNLTMLALGQPLHPFDLDKLPEQAITVMESADGWSVTTLDGKERTLKAGDLLITSGKSTVALAGVMGAEVAEIDESTKRAVIESATFDAPTVATCSRRLGLSSEAAYRMARGIDPKITEKALGYFNNLVSQWGVAKVYNKHWTVAPKSYNELVIPFNTDHLTVLTGRPELVSQVDDTLIRLGFEKKTDGWLVPSYRRDISIERDLVEEVARIAGYDCGEAIIPAPHEPGSQGKFMRTWRALRSAAVAHGYCEVVTYSFVSSELLDRFKAKDGVMELSNPLSLDLSAMRPIVLPSLLAAAEKAVKRGWRKAVRLAEMGRTFIPCETTIEEEDHFCFLVCNPVDNRSPYGDGENIDFFSVKADLEAMIGALGYRVTCKQASLPYGHSGQTAQLFVGDKPIGWLAQVKPQVAAAFDLKTECYFAEFNVAPLEKELKPVYSVPGEFPPSYRDIAMLVDKNEPSKELEEKLLALGQPLAKRVRLFDHYEGKGIPEGKKSLAFSVAYQRDDRTLRDTEVEEKHNALRDELQAQGYELR